LRFYRTEQNSKAQQLSGKNRDYSI
jgi:hypothetical protein